MDQKTTSSSQPIRVIELFAGVGGFRLGFEGYNANGMTLPSAGPFTTVWANQWEPPGTVGRQFAARCYQERFRSEERRVGKELRCRWRG